MIESINNFMSKIASGYKTFVASGVLTFVSVYANTKGFDVEQIQLWVESGFNHVNNLIIALGALVIWFRQLGKKETQNEEKL